MRAEVVEIIEDNAHIPVQKKCRTEIATAVRIILDYLIHKNTRPNTDI